jgi:antitoxin component YwqK of YwqJK toxin-antitoxin module
MRFYFLCIFSISFVSCFSQADKYAIGNFKESDMLFKKDLRYPYRYYRSNSDTSLWMEERYWDTGKTKLMARYFLQSKLYNGPFLSLAENGDTIATGGYLNNKRNGRYRYFFLKKIQSESWYSNGVKIGTWKEYTENGTLKEQIVFDSLGNIVSRKSFH